VIFLRLIVLLLIGLMSGPGGQTAAFAATDCGGCRSFSACCAGGREGELLGARDRRVGAAIMRFWSLTVDAIRVVPGPAPLTPPSQGGGRYSRRLQPFSAGQVSILEVTRRELDATDSPTREALREGKYPWYDSRTDRVQPIWPVRVLWLERLADRVTSFLRRIVRFFDRFSFGGSGISAAGNSIGTILLLAALVAFFVCIVMLWIYRETGALRSEAERARLGAAGRLGDLPEGIRPEDSDPWAEAKRRRAAGDLAGAVVCLFAHQLLTLDQMGLIRLAPGRTGRHYLQGLRDRELIDCVGATLRLFEDVYYGRRSPTAQAFESVWSQAQLFQERQRTLASRVSP
jgi:hypothetical protein